jgi:hypothetical protein
VRAALVQVVQVIVTLWSAVSLKTTFAMCGARTLQKVGLAGRQLVAGRQGAGAQGAGAALVGRDGEDHRVALES